MRSLVINSGGHGKAVIFAAVYLVVAVAALMLTKGASSIAAVWPGSGIMLVGLLLLQKKPRRTLYIAVFAASFVANAAIGLPPATALAFSIANIAEAWVCRFLILKFARQTDDIADAYNIVAACFSALVAACTSASIAGLLTQSTDPAFLFSWASTVFFGIVTVAPALLFIKADFHAENRSALSILIATGLAFVAGAAAFWQDGFPLLWLPIVAACVATYRLGLTGAGVSLLALATTGVVKSSISTGAPNAFYAFVGDTLFLQIYLLGVLAALLPVASLLNKYQSLVADLTVAKAAADEKAAEAVHMAEVDALTGVANRGKVMSCFRAEVAQCLATRKILSVLMIDVDHFKSVNDRFGHAKGDLALIAIANAAQPLATKEGLFGRIGGEEFLLVLPGCDVAKAMEIAEQLREVIRNVDWAAQGMSPITLSIGAAQHAPHDDDSALLGKADAQLYVAKHSGRNRVSAAV